VALLHPAHLLLFDFSTPAFYDCCSNHTKDLAIVDSLQSVLICPLKRKRTTACRHPDLVADIKAGNDEALRLCHRDSLGLQHCNSKDNKRIFKPSEKLTKKRAPLDMGTCMHTYLSYGLKILVNFQALNTCSSGMITKTCGVFVDV